MSIERTQNTKPLGEQPTCDRSGVVKTYLLKPLMWFRRLLVEVDPSGFYEPFAGAVYVGLPEQQYPKVLRIIIPANITPEKLEIVGSWGDSFPAVQLIPLGRPQTGSQHDESTHSTDPDAVLYATFEDHLA